MAEDLKIHQGESKEEKYATLLPQIYSLIESEKNLVANLANISAAIWQTFHPLWCGFYLVEENELVLGPFQGPVACTRIAYGRGVCGSAWKEQKTIIVPDVNKFPGHIACSSLSKSEIVVPICKEQMVHMILDIDSEQFDHFDKTDKKYLEEISKMIIEHHNFS